MKMSSRVYNAAVRSESASAYNLVSDVDMKSSH